MKNQEVLCKNLIIKDTVTGRMEWKPIESLGGNAGGCEIVG